MIFEKEDLENFNVIDKQGDNITITDGLITYNLKMTNDDIFDILALKFNRLILSPESLKLEYELSKNEVVREYLNDNEQEFNKLKNRVEDFYSNIKDFNFIDFDQWYNNYHQFYEICVSSDNEKNPVFSLSVYNQGVDGFLINVLDNLNSFESTLNYLKNEIKDLQTLQDDLTIYAEDHREQLLGDLNNKLESYDLNTIPIKKYKDETEVVNIIKELNSDNKENLQIFLDKNNHSSNHILSHYGDVFAHLLRDTDGSYGTNCLQYNTDDYMSFAKIDIIGSVTLDIKDILNGTDIIYQPTLEECKDIKEKVYIRDRESKKASLDGIEVTK